MTHPLDCFWVIKWIALHHTPLFVILEWKTPIWWTKEAKVVLRMIHKREGSSVLCTESQLARAQWRKLLKKWIESWESFDALSLRYFKPWSFGKKLVGVQSYRRSTSLRCSSDFSMVEHAWQLSRESKSLMMCFAFWKIFSEAALFRAQKWTHQKRRHVQQTANPKMSAKTRTKLFRGTVLSHNFSRN